MAEWLEACERRVAGDLEWSPPECLVEWRITPIEFSQLREAMSRADYDVLGRDRQVALAVGDHAVECCQAASRRICECGAAQRVFSNADTAATASVFPGYAGKRAFNGLF